LWQAKHATKKTTIQYLIPKHDITKQDLQKMQSPTIKKGLNKTKIRRAKSGGV